MRNHTFKGEELENLTVVTIKLQAEYLAVLEKEQQTEHSTCKLKETMTYLRNEELTNMHT